MSVLPRRVEPHAHRPGPQWHAFQLTLLHPPTPCSVLHMQRGGSHNRHCRRPQRIKVGAGNWQQSSSQSSYRWALSWYQVNMAKGVCKM